MYELFSAGKKVSRFPAAAPVPPSRSGIAAQSNADFIVTGDKDLLEIREFLGSRTIVPADFLRVIEVE